MVSSLPPCAGLSLQLTVVLWEGRRRVTGYNCCRRREKLAGHLGQAEPEGATAYEPQVLNHHLCSGPPVEQAPAPEAGRRGLDPSPGSREALAG